MNISQPKSIFDVENRKKKRCYVRMNEIMVVDSSHTIFIDLGSCVSVVLCGINSEGKVWVGANHLFKSRDENMDLSLQTTTFQFLRNLE